MPYILRAVQHDEKVNQEASSATTQGDRTPPVHTFVGDVYTHGVMQGRRWDEEKLKKLRLVRINPGGTQVPNMQTEAPRIWHCYVCAFENPGNPVPRCSSNGRILQPPLYISHLPRASELIEPCNNPRNRSNDNRRMN